MRVWIASGYSGRSLFGVDVALKIFSKWEAAGGLGNLGVMGMVVSGISGVIIG